MSGLLIDKEMKNDEEMFHPDKTSDTPPQLRLSMLNANLSIHLMMSIS